MSEVSLSPDCMAFDLEVENRKALLQWASETLARTFGIDAEACFAALSNREKLGSTALDNGTALPHSPVEGVNDALLCFARLAKPIVFSPNDARPVDIVVVVLLPGKKTSSGFPIISYVAKRLRDEDTAKALRNAHTPEAVRDLLDFASLATEKT